MFEIKKTNLLEARLLTLSYLLMWVILFNHAAESNTHIISIMGVAIWFVVVPKSRFTLGLLVFAFFLVCSITVFELLYNWNNIFKSYIWEIAKCHVCFLSRITRKDYCIVVLCPI